MRKIFWLIFLLIFTSFLSCSLLDKPDKDTNDLFEYTVFIDNLVQNGCSVEIKIPKSRGVVNFIVPPYYADNPFLKPNGKVFEIKSITDTKGNSIAYDSFSVNLGDYSSGCISFNTPDDGAYFSYNVNFNYKVDTTFSDNTYMPVPGMNDTLRYAQGNYFLAIPVNNISSNIPHIWRENHNITLEFICPDTIVVLGKTPNGFILKNNYELSFCNVGVMSTDYYNSNKLIDNVEFMGQKVELVNVNENLNPPEIGINEMEICFERILKDLVPLFGSFNSKISILTGFNTKIGLEGMYAICIFNPKDDDWPLDENRVMGWMGMTLAHEFIHNWVGIRIGEYDAPWWKEGTTYYLGFLVGMRQKLITKKMFEEKFLFCDFDLKIDSANLDSKYSLSSEYIRKSLYNDRACGQIVYKKGGHIAFLIDNLIRESTDNNYDLLDVMAEFYKVYMDRSFYLDDYFYFISNMTGCNVNKLYKLRDEYINTPKFVPPDTLQKIYDYFLQINAFNGN